MDEGEGDCVVPAMPMIHEQDDREHRPKLQSHSLFQYAMVARSLGRKEMLSNEDALNAVRKEWTMLHEKVWDVRKVCSKRKVIEEARRNKKVVQFGRVHALCHEKNEELPLGHPNRKFKGRVVFLGNNVVNQDYESAVFADLGNAPSSLESGRLVDAYGASEGCSSQTADAIFKPTYNLKCRVTNVGSPCQKKRNPVKCGVHSITRLRL